MLSQAVTKFLLEKASKAGRGSEMEDVLGEVGATDCVKHVLFIYSELL